MITCKECPKLFETHKSFNAHLRGHKLKIKSYYEKHYPKVCLQTGKKLQWKNGDDVESYLSRDFIDRIALNLYFNDVENKKEEKKSWLLSYLGESYKKHNILPSQIELASLPMSPTLLNCKDYFNLKDMFAILGMETRFDYSIDYSRKLKLPQISPEDLVINIDTREQQSYRFFNSIVGKLSVGDYALAGKNFNNVAIERKSISDFGGTVVAGNERFRRELDRVRAEEKYLIVLVEFNIHELYKHKFYGYSTPAFVAHNARNLIRDYSDVCQFVFGGNRTTCIPLVMEFLLYGQKCRTTDLQLLVDMRASQFNTQEFTKEDLAKLY